MLKRDQNKWLQQSSYTAMIIMDRGIQKKLMQGRVVK